MCKYNEQWSVCIYIYIILQFRKVVGNVVVMYPNNYHNCGINIYMNVDNGSYKGEVSGATRLDILTNTLI